MSSVRMIWNIMWSLYYKHVVIADTLPIYYFIVLNATTIPYCLGFYIPAVGRFNIFHLCINIKHDV